MNEGYAPTFKALMEETAWEQYGTGKNPKCDNCMAHCGYEGSAVSDALAHPLKALAGLDSRTAHRRPLGARTADPIRDQRADRAADRDRQEARQAPASFQLKTLGARSSRP